MARFDETAITAATENNLFAGYTISPADNTITVYETPAATSADEGKIEHLSLPGGVSLHFQPVALSWARLSSVQSRVPAMLPTALSPLLTEVDVDAAHNGIAITLSSIPANAQAAVDAAFGSVPVALGTGQPYRQGHGHPLTPLVEQGHQRAKGRSVAEGELV